MWITKQLLINQSTCSMTYEELLNILKVIESYYERHRDIKKKAKNKNINVQRISFQDVLFINDHIKRKIKNNGNNLKSLKEKPEMKCLNNFCFN